jgi:hypothetical protein
MNKSAVTTSTLVGLGERLAVRRTAAGDLPNRSNKH